MGSSSPIRQRKADYPVSGFWRTRCRAPSVRSERTPTGACSALIRPTFLRRWRAINGRPVSRQASATATPRRTPRHPTLGASLTPAPERTSRSQGSLSPTAPAFWQLDVRADYKILRPGWRLEPSGSAERHQPSKHRRGELQHGLHRTRVHLRLPLIPSFGIKECSR